ncbi:hypothetical protein CORT_0B09630 [Candida orthopsilosis Co 90-125]|uniref:PXA domain-containing protein n=1 Tax=Candida orthopsilosis (strain 90-125) TaxID=1136231 RepID=H8X0F5_CANO9|nr:hypothetical protein CORT_0B09630 [Candida orthopsilosis Co 90-125]CCG22667.1 hypothetical protein CORT_0B09630 [Candida orthopsilosis Co 90-125]
MDRYQDKPKPRSRPVSAIISTTTTNVTSHDHGTSFSPTSATSLTSLTSHQIPRTQPTSTSTNLLRKSEPSKLLQTPRISLEKALRKSPTLITKKDILKNELRTAGNSNIDESNHDRLELQFLVSIYVPGLRPLRNASLLDRLRNRLPTIVENLDVNLSLHLFLSTIMVRFVNSWYLTKLNTNNKEFLKAVYDDILVALVRDVANRIATISSYHLLNVADDLVSILNTHLTEFVAEGKYPYKVLDDYYDLTETANSLYYDSFKNPRDVLQMYLSQKHIIFDQSKDTQEEPVLIYFRVMVQTMLQKIMENNEKDSIFTSKITSDLLILALGDLVINQLFQKTSSPEFILGSINKAVLSLLSVLKKHKNTKASATVSNQSVIGIVVTFAYTIYESLVMLVMAIKLSSRYEAPFDVINSSVFLLVGTLLTLKQTRPLLYTLALSLKSVIWSISGLKNGINNVASKYAIEYLSETLTEETIRNLINQLRIELFYTDKKDISHEDQDVLLDTVADNIAELFTHLPFGKQLHLNILCNKIKQVLIIFDHDEQLDPANNVNQLLVIQFLDRIVYAVYNDI